jgi:hypothetical protein
MRTIFHTKNRGITIELEEDEGLSLVTSKDRATITVVTLPVVSPETREEQKEEDNLDDAEEPTYPKQEKPVSLGEILRWSLHKPLIGKEVDAHFAYNFKQDNGEWAAACTYQNGGYLYWLVDKCAYLEAQPGDKVQMLVLEPAPHYFVATTVFVISGNPYTGEDSLPDKYAELDIADRDLLRDLAGTVAEKMAESYNPDGMEEILEVLQKVRKNLPWDKLTCICDVAGMLPDTEFPRVLTTALEETLSWAPNKMARLKADGTEPIGCATVTQAIKLTNIDNERRTLRGQQARHFLLEYMQEHIRFLQMEATPPTKE